MIQTIPHVQLAALSFGQQHILTHCYFTAQFGRYPGARYISPEAPRVLEWLPA